MRISDWSSDVCSSDLLVPGDRARDLAVIAVLVQMIVGMVVIGADDIFEEPAGRRGQAQLARPLLEILGKGVGEFGVGVARRHRAVGAALVIDRKSTRLNSSP